MKLTSSTLVNVILSIILLSSLLLIGTTSSASTRGVGEYDPWCDFDDDGDIDIFDIVDIAGRYGTTGEPFAAKAALEYDSGWIDITDKCGQFFNITHNSNISELDSINAIVEIIGKTALDNGLLRSLGLKHSSEWNKTYGGSGDDRAHCIIQTRDRGYAIVGPTYSYANSYDFWLVKTDVSGNMVWNRTYGGARKDWPSSLIQTIDGGYAITGYTQVGDTNYDIWLVKTDNEGIMQWNQTYGISENDLDGSVIQTSDGGYAIAGKNDFLGAGWDFYLVKTDEFGSIEWNRTYGGAEDDFAYCVVLTPDGGYIVAGVTNSFGAGGRDTWLVKTDELGNMEWNKTYGGAEDDYAIHMVQTSDEGYAIAGCSMSYGFGALDYWLTKTDASGVVQWNQTYGGYNNDEARTLVHTDDGGFAIAGSTWSFGAGNADFWIVKTDADGRMQWNKTYGGIFEDRAYSMVQTSKGEYAIVGFTESFGIGNKDGWLVRVGAENGLVWTDSTANIITLYRGETDACWNYVRVRVWKIKEAP